MKITKRLPWFLFICAAAGFLAGDMVAAESNPLIDVGMPAPDHAWSGSDYEKASQALSSGKVPLPRMSDAQGKAMLLRMTAVENLAFMKDKKQPVMNRAEESLKILDATKTILGLYLDAGHKGEKIYTEMTVLMAHMLRLAGAIDVVVEEFVSTIPKDETYEARMAGLKELNRGLTTIFGGTVLSLSEKEFSAVDLTLLLDAMAETLPTLRKAFPPGYETGLKKSLTDLKPKFPGAQDAKNLQSMIDVLQD